jgi:hypothetical protein
MNSSSPLSPSNSSSVIKIVIEWRLSERWDIEVNHAGCFYASRRFLNGLGFPSNHSDLDKTGQTLRNHLTCFEKSPFSIKVSTFPTKSQTFLKEAHFESSSTSIPSITETCDLKQDSKFRARMADELPSLAEISVLLQQTM